MEAFFGELIKILKQWSQNRVELESNYAQGIYFPLSWIIIVSYTLMLIWFRKVQQNNLNINYKLYILAIISWIIIFVWAVAYASTVLIDKPVGTRVMITSAFLITVFWFLSVLMFYTHWTKNRYSFYKRHKFNVRGDIPHKKKKAKQNSQLRIEEVKIQQKNEDKNINHPEISDESNLKSDSNYNDSDQVPNKVNNKETFLEMITPEDKEDFICPLIFWINIIVLTLFMIINVSTYTPVWVPFIWYFWIIIIEFGMIASVIHYTSNFKFNRPWIIVSILVIIPLFIASLICFSYGANKADDLKITVIIILLLLHIALPFAIVFILVWLQFKYGSQNETSLFIKRLVLLIMTIIFFIILGIVLMSVWSLYASGSGSFLIVLNLILYIVLDLSFIKRLIDTKLKKKIVLLSFNIAVILVIIIILASTLSDKSKAVLEIISFVIYIFLTFFLIRFFQEYRTNKMKMINQIYIYSYKFMPMLKFQSSGSGANGEMIENNAEQLYFWIWSIGFMFWALLSGLLLSDSKKYVAFSLSSFGLILIFLYIFTRVHQGRSLKINDLLLIERDHYLDLQKQALIYRDRQKNLSKDVIYKNQFDREALDKISNEREAILSRHKEWISLYTVLSQRWHSKLKCGSENAHPQEPFKLEEVHNIVKAFVVTPHEMCEIFVINVFEMTFIAQFIN